MSIDDFFAPPPFKPDEALAKLRRELRDLGLTERGGQFECSGQAIARVSVSPDAASLQAALVRAPARTPQWQDRTLRQHADLRDFVTACKQLLARQASDD
jgi:hypothetical protein